MRPCNITLAAVLRSFPVSTAVADRARAAFADLAAIAASAVDLAQKVLASSAVAPQVLVSRRPAVDQLRSVQLPLLQSPLRAFGEVAARLVAARTIYTQALATTDAAGVTDKLDGSIRQLFTKFCQVLDRAQATATAWRDETMAMPSTSVGVASPVMDAAPEAPPAASGSVLLWGLGGAAALGLGAALRGRGAHSRGLSGVRAMFGGGVEACVEKKMARSKATTAEGRRRAEERARRSCERRRG